MGKAKHTDKLAVKAFAAACAVLLALVAGIAASCQPSSDDGLEAATVERVVDGDTLKVSLGGSSERVRLIGIDAPESVHPDESRNTEEGAAASDYTKSLVSEGNTVWLQKDVSDTDRYNRLLRYVWLEEPVDVNDEEEIETKMLNAILVADGYAKAKRYEPDVAYAEILEELERR